MASGSYAKKPAPQNSATTQSFIPPRATAPTRQLPAIEEELEEAGEGPLRSTIGARFIAPSASLGTRFIASALQVVKPAEKITMSYHENRMGGTKRSLAVKVVDEYEPHPLTRHMPWLKPFLICLVCAIVFSGVLLSAGVFQRSGDPQLVNYFGGQVYSVQVGGNLADKWQGDAPLAPKVPLPTNAGPYSVLGKPSISADFINQVLAAYNSPAAGKGQALYDMGVKYGIDPAFALAFFLHESSFGTAGEARSTLSLGNLRCIPNFKCQDGYAWFNTWEDGFEAWYKLIRNLYIAYWGLTTVDQIIPRYAPTADNNDEAAYIASLKHTITVWHSGQISV